MSKGLKNVVTLMIIIVIIIIITLMLLIFMQYKSETFEEEIDYGDGAAAEVPTLIEAEAETSNNVYLLSEEYIERFFEYVAQSNAEAAFALLDEDYIEENNLSESNVLQAFSNYSSIHSYSIREIYTQEVAYLQDYSCGYKYTKGILRRNSSEEYLYVLIKEDYLDSTFSLTFITEDEYNAVKYGQNTGNDTEIEIAENEYNATSSVFANVYTLCEHFMQDYIDTVDNNPKYGYSLLDEEYKNAKFNSENDFVSYINDNGGWSTYAIEEYYTNTDSDAEYKQYVVIDGDENYFLFTVSSGMEYTIILDTYTVELPEFLEKYESTTDQGKVVLNLNKIRLAINDGDYEYVYSKLADSFKSTYFTDYSIFEQYMSLVFFDNNVFEYVSFGNDNSSYYTYDVNITDKTRKLVFCDFEDVYCDFRRRHRFRNFV